LTLHRTENVDNKKKITSVIDAIEKIYTIYRLPIIYPIHPRTKKMISLFKIKTPKGLVVVSPIGYLDFLTLQSNAKIILTDSGGVQEEACVLKVPCVTLRENTERPETISIGSNLLVGNKSDVIIKGVQLMVNKKPEWVNPFGDGNASRKIAMYLNDLPSS
jgi:UDP-N-acetylglucosamine 2-epimerase (non-hydrolysing)